MKKVVYTAQEEQQLMTHLLNPELANDPYKWVMAVFPWGEKGKPLARFKGPRKWQIAVLKRIAKHIWEGKTFNLHRLLQLARVSGRGIGKSALVAWLVLWFLSTRIGATTIISANNEEQLRKTTFAEVMKWNTMALNSHWFEVVGITVTPAKWLKEIVERDLHKGTGAWGAFGKLWSEDNPDGYAGAHNYEGMMLIFDEASGIPDSIWSVGKGFFTEPTDNRFWFAFSQGRRNSGTFHGIFHGPQRKFWDSDSIDARKVEGTDPTVYEEIIEEHGDDSDEARVEVYGMFPKNDGSSFISLAMVDAAVGRVVPDDKTAPIIIGVDPSGGEEGSDKFVLVVRQGRRILDIQRFDLEDSDIGTMEGVGHVIMAINKYKPLFTVIDQGGLGLPIRDRLVEQKYKVRGVNFGWKSLKPQRYKNKRAEMWGAMKKWVEGACLPDDKWLKAELVAPKTKPTSEGIIQLESKRDMKLRKVASPDTADALAVTFAFPVGTRGGILSEAAKQAGTPARIRRHRSGNTSAAWLGN
jgi:hypothetical protein